MLNDVTLYCRSCSQSFLFTVKEQKFFVSKNITNPPSLCPMCRAQRKADHMQDKMIWCIDCNQSFTFTKGEQDYYAQRGLNPPTRCRDCREKRKVEPKSNTQSNGTGYTQQVYSAYCADCGQLTEVPFKPKPGRAIYCRSCYRAHKTS